MDMETNNDDVDGGGDTTATTTTTVVENPSSSLPIDDDSSVVVVVEAPNGNGPEGDVIKTVETEQVIQNDTDGGESSVPFPPPLNTTTTITAAEDDDNNGGGGGGDDVDGDFTNNNTVTPPQLSILVPIPPKHNEDDEDYEEEEEEEDNDDFDNNIRTSSSSRQQIAPTNLIHHHHHSSSGSGSGSGSGYVGDQFHTPTSTPSSFLPGNDTPEEQAAFMRELVDFHRHNYLEFKPPKFYGEPLNLLKLFREVVKLGGYEHVTLYKLWRQVGYSFNPPKTCTTVSWTFRVFYEKALLEYEKHKTRIGELPFANGSYSEPAVAVDQVSINQAPGSGRTRRDAAARAMQGWHSQGLLDNGEVGDPMEKNAISLPKREKQLKSIGLLKRKAPSAVEYAVNVAGMKHSKSQSDDMVVDIGPPADWVKINVQKTKDCFEVYALVPGLLREEVRVQSDPAGRLVISGEPEKLENPWGVTPLKKVVSLPSRIDPHQTSAVVTLQGQLFVRVPFEQPDL